MKTQKGSGLNPVRDAAVSLAVFFILFISGVFVFRYYANKKQSKPVASAHQTHGQAKTESDRFDPVDINLPHPIHDSPDPAGQPRPAPALAGVHPPLPAFNVPMTRKQVDASVGETITLKTLTKIQIPPGAFLDQDGKPVVGKVDVAYREFRDFREIFLSGIPMKYDSGHAGGMLESAGMMELTASKDNMPVYPNPESRIRVMLASAMKTSDYSIYYFDKKENKWKYKGKDEVVLQTDNRVAEKPKPRIVNPDVRFDFNSKRYVVRIQCVSDMRDQRAFFLSKKKAPVVFDFRFAHAGNLYPELKELKKITWRYRGTDAQDVFLQVFGIPKSDRGTFISRMFEGRAELTVDSSLGSSPYRLHVLAENTDLSIPVEPIVDTDMKRKLFEKKWAIYEKLRTDRVNSAWNEYEKFKKDSAAFIDKFASENTSILKSQTVALRTFEIDGFGIWNCDRQFVPPTANAVAASFRDEQGRALRFKMGYMVERGRNSVYTISEFSNFRFDPDAKNMFWAVLPGDKLAIVYPDEFTKNKAVKGGACTFTMKVSDNALDTYANLREALSFN